MTSAGTVISYPIPVYQNLPIESQFYQPSQFFILNITLGVTTTIQMTTSVNYVVGQEIRLLIPATSGCSQLNGVTGIITQITASDTIVTNINSSKNVDLFKSSSAANQPQIVAIGDINPGDVSSNGASNVPTGIPGAFINISPE